MPDKMATLVASLVISALGAGSGVAAWFEFFYQAPLALSRPFSQDDFDSPMYLAFTLQREATLTIVATASNLVHVPAEVNGTRLRGAGLSLQVTVDNEPCSTDDYFEPAPILAGRKRLQIDTTCSQKLGPGRHFARVQATALGNCVQPPQVPDTCHTSRIRGAYSLLE